MVIQKNCINRNEILNVYKKTMFTTNDKKNKNYERR